LLFKGTGPMLAAMDRQAKRERLRAAAAVALLHLAIGYALVSGLGVRIVRNLSPQLKLFDVALPPPPPAPKTVPARQRTPRPEGAASPTSLKASPSPIIAPPALVPVLSPLPTTPKATPVPPGSDRDAGSSTVDGPGTGAGGLGDGTGSGGQGDGTGGGGATPAVRISGALDGTRDYPKASRKAGVEGTVWVQFTVAPDGRVDLCRVTRSTANAEIDATTCRLIQRRFVYRPARDAGDRPVAEVVRRTFDWTLPRRREQAD
jgi:protein TonB